MSIFDSPRLQYAFCIILSGTSWQVERQACHCHLASLLLGSNPWDKPTLLQLAMLARKIYLEYFERMAATSMQQGSKFCKEEIAP